MMRKTFFFLCCFLLLSSCQKNNFSIYYNDENFDRQKFPLAKASFVKVIETTDLSGRFQEYRNQGYILLGSAHFIDEWTARALAVDTAKEKGASVVILSSTKVNEAEHNYVLTIPNPTVSYYSGTVGNNSYHGTSTSYSYQYVNQSYKTNIYEQFALFLAKGKSGAEK